MYTVICNLNSTLRRILMNTIFQGSAVASITPFNEKGVDYEAFLKLIEFQIKNGTKAIVVLGTTGEPSTLTDAEKKEIISFAVKTVNGRTKVIAGTGGNNTLKVIENSRQAENLGADALLIVTPYYNKCTQNGLIAHYNTIADNVSIPIIAYNVPSRTGLNMLPKTFAKMAQHKNIAALKEASGNIDQIAEVCSLTYGKAAVYSGDDAATLPMLSMGALGVISVAANIVPKFMSDLCKSFFDNDLKKALSLHNKLYSLVKALFIEVSPIPVKAAAGLMGLCNETLRMPLTKIEEENLSVLKAKLSEFGLI